ncbi:MAG: hypothetical protein Q9225_006591 [Loekoesia sp. 1 TL-2023]
MPQSIGQSLSWPPPVHKGLTAQQAKDFSSMRHYNSAGLDHGHDLDDETHDIDQENLDPWSQLAPETQKQDSATGTPRKRKIFRPLQFAPPSLDPTILKCINHFARRHQFFTEQSFNKYTTSQRRNFERDVYDYARSIGLSKPQAKASIIDARRLCGEEDYHSDETRLDDDEVDDSSALLLTLPASTGRSSQGSQALPSTKAEGQARRGGVEIGNKRKQADDARDHASEKKRRANEDAPVNESTSFKVQDKNPDQLAVATMTPAILEIRKQSPSDNSEDEGPEELPSKPKTIPRPVPDGIPQLPATALNETTSDAQERINAEAEHQRDNHQSGNKTKQSTGEKKKMTENQENRRHGDKPKANLGAADSTARCDNVQTTHNATENLRPQSHSGPRKHGPAMNAAPLPSQAGGKQGDMHSIVQNDIRIQLLDSFEYAASKYYDKHIIDSLMEKMTESIHFALDLMSHEDKRGERKLVESLKKAFKNGAKEYCKATPQKNFQSGVTLRRTLKAHIDAAVGRYRTAKEQEIPGEGTNSMEVGGTKENQSVSRSPKHGQQAEKTSAFQAVQNAAKVSKSKHHRSDPHSREANGQLATAGLNGSKADQKLQQNKGEEKSSVLLFSEWEATKSCHEENPTAGVQELTQDYDVEQLVNETKMSLLNALDAPVQTNDVKVLPEDEHEPIKTRANIVQLNVSAHVADRREPNQENNRPSRQTNKSPFECYSQMSNAWHPAGSCDFSAFDADPNTIFPEDPEDEDLGEVVILEAGETLEDYRNRRKDGHPVVNHESEDVQPKEEPITVKPEELEPAQGFSCAGIRQHSLGVEGQGPHRLRPSYAEPEPSPWQCRLCKESFAAKSPLYRHLRFCHNRGYHSKVQRNQRKHSEETPEIKQEDTTSQMDAEFHFRVSEIRRSNGPLTASRDFQNPMIR